MNQITIIGAGVAGRALAEALRLKQPDLPITLIDKECFYCPRENLIVNPGDTSQRLSLSEWAQQRQFTYINGRVERINPRRQKIFLKESEPLAFETLVLATGLSSKKITVKGEHREGFFYLSDIDPPRLRDLLKINREATIQVCTWLGLRLAQALSELKKEVKVIARDFDFLGPYRQRVINALKEKNIDIYLDAAIEEAVGEATVKAAKIAPLKVFSSQLVFIDSGLVSNLDFFEEPLEVASSFGTNFSNLYVIGDAADPAVTADLYCINNYERAKQSAELFADFLLSGKKPVVVKKVVEDSDIQSAYSVLLGASEESPPGLSKLEQLSKPVGE